MVSFENRDRVEMQLIAEPAVQAVLEFMLSNIPTHKLVGVAGSVSEMARLLWSEYPQEPVPAIRLCAKLPSLSTSCEKQPSAI
jgi:hypothetical protein